MLALLLGALVPLTIGPVPAAGQNADEDEVACPASLDGVPLSLDEEFAGTPRALANDEGVLVRFTLLCPYRRTSGAAVADLTLAWSRFSAEDLSCATLELTSEDAEDGRVQGLVDHPRLRAQVTYGAASPAVVPAVEVAATALLAVVPSDAHPGEGGPATAVDADLGPTTAASSSGLPLAPVLLVLTVSAIVGLAAVLLMRRPKGDRSSAVAGADPDVDPDVAAPAAASTPPRSHPPSDGGVPPDDEVAATAARRQNAVEILVGAGALMADIEACLDEARSQIGLHRAHAAAVRRLAASVQAGDRAEFVYSYAGVTTLAVAATNLVCTSARRAASLVATGAGDPDPTAALAAELEVLHLRVLAAAEGGLDDTRYWLWQDRRLAVMDALGALERLAPRLVVAQERLVARIAELSRRHARAAEEASWAREVIADADRWLSAGDPRAPGRSWPDNASSDHPFERAGV